MTNGNSDRLDRIERTLERVAERYESIARRDEITAIRLERLSLQQEEQNRQINQIRTIAESNSRTVQALLEQQASERLKHEKRMEYLEGLVTRLVSLEEGQNRMLANLDENQPTVLRKLSVIGGWQRFMNFTTISPSKSYSD